MRRYFQRIWRDRSGQDLIEYALMVALVATGSAILLPTEIRNNLEHIFSRVGSSLGRFGNGQG